MAINKILKLEGSSITWTFKQIVKMIDNDKIRFNNVVQRSFTWEIKRRSELIWSIIMGYPIPPIYAERGDTDNEKIKVFDVMDGQQRNMSIYKFMKDEFALSELKPIPYLDEEGNECKIDISGMKFSELDEEIQDVIKDATISIKYFDNLEQVQKAEMFRRLNNGKPLSTKNRLLASCQDIEGLLDIGSHKLFEEMLTDKAKENKNQVALVMKTWCMMNQSIKDVSFESKVFNPLLENTEVSETEKLALIEVFNLIFDTHYNLMERKEKKVAKKLYTETHLISLIPYFKKAVESGIDEELMADWVVEFFGTTEGASISDSYNEAAGSGSAKSINIQARDKALADSYVEFFKTENEVVEDEVVETTDEEVEEKKRRSCSGKFY